MQKPSGAVPSPAQSEKDKQLWNAQCLRKSPWLLSSYQVIISEIRKGQERIYIFIYLFTDSSLSRQPGEALYLGPLKVYSLLLPSQ